MSYFLKRGGVGRKCLEVHVCAAGAVVIDTARSFCSENVWFLSLLYKGIPCALQTRFYHGSKQYGTV